jgi:hypothetical protein
MHGRLPGIYGAFHYYAHYDLEVAREKLEGRLEKEVIPMTQVA